MNRIIFSPKQIEVNEIKPFGRVIDIGSGNNPHYNAHVLVDLHIDSDSERAGRIRKFPYQTLVKADVQKLPFKDKEFDFSYCCHLLEHVEDPVAACNEISRISRCGYIETPSAMSEFVNPFPFHKWIIDIDKGNLIFIRKPENYTPYTGEFRKMVSFSYKGPNKIWYKEYSHPDGHIIWNLKFYWRNFINAKIVDLEDYI
jgi:hypothetical protein